jgi:hypothetical protein
LALISGVLQWSTVAHGVGSHCSDIGVARAMCAEVLQKLVIHRHAVIGVASG